LLLDAGYETWFSLSCLAIVLGFVCFVSRFVFDRFEKNTRYFERASIASIDPSALLTTPGLASIVFIVGVISTWFGLRVWRFMFRVSCFPCAAFHIRVLVLEVFAFGISKPARIAKV